MTLFRSSPLALSPLIQCLAVARLDVCTLCLTLFCICNTLHFYFLVSSFSAFDRVVIGTAFGLYVFTLAVLLSPIDLIIVVICWTLIKLCYLMFYYLITICFIEHVKSGKTTYVHCKAGRGRSTTIVLCYLVCFYCFDIFFL